MKYTDHMDGCGNFELVEQDKPGIALTTGKGGLYTENLMNCMCLILTDEEGKYGMLHVSPGHPNTAEWVSSLREQVGATVAIVTGANSGKQNDGRANELESLLRGLSVVDETRSHWVPDTLHPVRGLHQSLVGYVGVSASTGEYALSAGPLA